MDGKRILFASLLFCLVSLISVVMALEADCKCCDIDSRCDPDAGGSGNCWGTRQQPYQTHTNDTGNWVRDGNGRVSYDPDTVCGKILIMHAGDTDCSGPVKNRYYPKAKNCYETCSDDCL